MTASISYLILLFIIGILLPINGIISGKRIKKFLIDYPDGKLMFYQQTVALQIILAVLVFGVMSINHDTINLIGSSFLLHPLKVILLLAVCFTGWALLWKYPFKPEKLKNELEKYKEVKFLLPSTDKAYRWSIGASFAAGICEEIVFRGFLYWQLAQFLPVVPAILITNLIFGLCHYGTGFKNASLAFALGVVLSIIFLISYSLMIPMMIHVLTDIYSMTKGRRYYQYYPVYDELEEE